MADARLLSRRDDGIVVVKRSEQDAGTQADAVPARLAEQLGPEATAGLVQLLDLAFDEQRSDMITAVTERFDRRLVEESASVRVQVATSEATLRQDMTKLESGLRHEMMKLEAGLRQEMATNRVELFKWSFLFWVGQVLATSAIVGVMLRLYRP